MYFFSNNRKLKQTFFACTSGCLVILKHEKQAAFTPCFSNNADMLILSSSPAPRCASWPAVERTLLKASWPLKPGRSSQIIILLYRKMSDDTYKKFQQTENLRSQCMWSTLRMTQFTKLHQGIEK